MNLENVGKADRMTLTSTPTSFQRDKTSSIGCFVMKHRSSLPGCTRDALGSNSWPERWRLIFWLPNLRACLYAKKGNRVSDDTLCLFSVEIAISGNYLGLTVRLHRLIRMSRGSCPGVWCRSLRLLGWRRRSGRRGRLIGRRRRGRTLRLFVRICDWFLGRLIG